MIDLPFRPSLKYDRFSTTIEGNLYWFTVKYNDQDKAFYFDIADENNEIIRYGIKIVLGTYLGRLSSHALFSEGVIVAVDTTGKGQDATFDDLGTRVIVRWIPAYQVQALERREIAL